MARSLFITYDGLTDPLGQSQILPYLVGLSSKGHSIHILSCEKADRFNQGRNLIDEICLDNGIEWTPLRFHTKPPILAKYYDLYKLKKVASSLHRKKSFDIIHCRSYLSADVGRRLKIQTGVKYVFDMRSFWVDERVEGGLWDTRHFFYRRAYNHWKRKEAKLIEDADHIISLTEAGKNEIMTWPCYKKTPITVIPCSADMQLFSLSTPEEKNQARDRLQLPRNGFVLSYLGSLGTWYLLDEMLSLFKLLKNNYTTARFLILTPDDPEKVYGSAEKFGLRKEDFIIQFSPRAQVPQLLKASDVSVSFIRPTYSKISSSPTKLGELLAMGIPVICNQIGDVRKIIEITNGGVVIDGFDPASFQPAVDYVLSEGKNMSIDRERVLGYYSLDGAIDKYHNVYQSLSEG